MLCIQVRKTHGQWSPGYLEQYPPYWSMMESICLWQEVTHSLRNLIYITASTHCSNKVCPLLLELTLCFLEICLHHFYANDAITSRVFLKNIQSCCFVDPSFSGQCNELIRSTWPRSKTVHGPLRLLQLQQPPAAAVRRYSTVRNGGDDNTAAAPTRWAF